MNVTLSLFAGVGAQFLDNNGNILSGGLVYTYSAGTTTPLATYTSNLGNVAHPNPIILDSAGRIPTGELWLSNGFGYKFIVKDANSTVIGTYDNVPSSAQPLISNDASSIYYAFGNPVNAGSFIVGNTYCIKTVGSTDFQSIGAISNQVGTYFIATGVGSGSGTAQLGRIVSAKLSDTVSVKDYGATGDGSTDDTAAIQNAINNNTNIYFPPGNYKVTSKLSVNKNNMNITGAGIDASVIINYSTDFILDIASLGGLNPTVVGGRLADLEFNGNGNGKCVRLYDVAQFRIERVKCHDSVAEGIRAEQAIDCSINECVSIDNATDGIALLDSTKNGVEFNTNAVQVISCVAYGNKNAGLLITRSRGNVIIGGEYSANEYNIDIQGGERNSFFGIWAENSPTRALRITNSTSPLGILYSGSYNKITDCMISTGVGTIEIASGVNNYLMGNYIGVNLNIGASAISTYLGSQSGLTGTVTDNGSGTINLSDPTAQYYKASGLKRFQLDIGTNVDITSDQPAIRLSQIKGISSTNIAANNLTGFVDITGAATSATVTFSTAETSAAYSVFFGVWHTTGTPASGSEQVYMTLRATTGFTINLRTAPGVGNTVRVSWLLIR